jgi:hypothetical protein
MLGVSTGIKGSKFRRFNGNPGSAGLIGDDAVMLYISFYMNPEIDRNLVTLAIPFPLYYGFRGKDFGFLRGTSQWRPRRAGPISQSRGSVEL